MTKQVEVTRELREAARRLLFSNIDDIAQALAEAEARGATRSALSEAELGELLYDLELLRAEAMAELRAGSPRSNTLLVSATRIEAALRAATSKPQAETTGEG